MSAKTPYLDPLNQAIADQAATQPSLETLTIEEFRKHIEELQQHDPIPGVARVSFTVPFQDGIKTFIFKPEGAKGNLPVIFYLHGGGWISCNVNTHDSICRDLALQTGFAVVFPEYDLAPEARFPSQHEQCYAVVKWVHEHGNSKGLSQTAFAVVGDSAGGQLTTAVTILASTRKPVIPIAFQAMISPVTDLVTSDRDTLSEFKFFNGPFLTVPFLRKTIDEYIPDPHDRTSELATARNISKANAKKQPPTLIIISSVDPLRDDGKLYGQILQQAGVDVAIFTAHGQLHNTAVFEGVREGATPRTVVSTIAGEIKRALQKQEEKSGEAGDMKSNGVRANGDDDTEASSKKRKTRSSR